MPEFETIEKTLTIPLDYMGRRFDQALSLMMPEYSRERIKSWIKEGDCLIDGQKVKPKDKVQGDETIVLKAELPVVSTWAPEDIPLNVVHEDDALIVIDKPAGMVVHPAAGNLEKTLVNALLYHYPELGQLPRAGIIHRLDKDTTGLLMVARNVVAHHALTDALAERKITRLYKAIVKGVYPAGGTIKEPIGRHPRDRTRMAVTSNGKPAVTHYRVLERFRKHTLLKVQLETGRTHQIRVHMSHVSSALIGDKSYGYRPLLPKHCDETLRTLLQTFPRQALHAYELQLTHPTTQELLTLQSPLPEDFQQLVEALRADTQQNSIDH